jgi:hypothetical protein
MSSDDDTIWPRLSALAAQASTAGLSRIFKSRELSRNTHLVSGLGLTGHDAYEFMENYATLFNVKPGDFDPSNYFDPEGLWVLPRMKKQKPKMPITLGMLELAARDGEWNSAKLNKLSCSD